jgi:hypothetical protein
MKSVADIIREQLEEEAYIRTHEAEILQLYINRAGLANKKRPRSVNGGEGENRIMELTKFQVDL